jgi:integrase/recombinase XerD
MEVNLPATLLPHRHSWLRELVESFLAHLAAKHYARGTLVYHARLLLAFGDFASQEGIKDVAQLPDVVDPFVATMRGVKMYRMKRRSKLQRFIGFLREQKTIPPAPAPPPGLGAAFVQDYLRSLRELRGLCSASVEISRRFCQALMDYLLTEGIYDLRCLRAESIHRFIAWEGKHYCRYTLRQRCSMLRKFLSFLYRRKIVDLDLAAAVVSPCVYKHEECPRFLTRSEIDTVLSIIDRQTPVGKRDYAMVLLLATYGLRGIEVVRLRLDDIDWRKELFQVHQRKAGNSSCYPLSAAVGTAILAYLQDIRRPGRDREVFLTLHAPYSPLAVGSLRTQVRHYLKLAGICVARPGTHSFRYSCAQRLFEHGEPLKTIGDFLGHRNPDSTERYTKIALDQLREVAAGDGENLL